MVSLEVFVVRTIQSLRNAVNTIGDWSALSEYGTILDVADADNTVSADCSGDPGEAYTQQRGVVEHVDDFVDYIEASLVKFEPCIAASEYLSANVLARMRRKVLVWLE